MLVDSHCHLDFPGFRAGAGCGACPRAKCGRRPFPHHRHRAEALCRRARRRRNRARYPLHRGRSSARGGRRAAFESRCAAGGKRASRKSSASARPGSIIITTTARARRRSRISAPISRRPARRIAAGGAHARCRGRHHRDSARGTGSRAPFSGVIHCFTGTARLAGAALELGFYISVSGIATFKKADALRATLKEVPLDRLLVETDAPYLAPQPTRGKRNEPAFIVHTAAMLAELKGVGADEMAHATTANFFRLFAKAKHRCHDADRLDGPRLGPPSSAAARPRACRGWAARTAAAIGAPAIRPIRRTAAAAARFCCVAATPMCSSIRRPICASNCLRRA